MKRAFVYFLSIAFAGLFTQGCGNTNTPSADSGMDSDATFDLTTMKKIIEERNIEFTKAHVTGHKDSAVLANMFTRDAKIFPPNSDAVIGSAAIAELNSLYLDYLITEFHEESISFYGNEDYLIDEGNYHMVYGEDNTREEGKYLNVWKKEDGEWKVFSNMWNTNAPVVATP